MNNQYQSFRDPINLTWLAAQQKFLGSNPSTGDSPPRGHPSTNPGPTCSTNAPQGLPVAVLDGAGTRLNTKALFYLMRGSTQHQSEPINLPCETS